jgi:hypothetical protein
MHQLEISLAIGMFAAVIAEISGIMNYIKWWLKVERFKPFDCAVCFSFWMALFYCSFSAQTIENFIFILGGSPIVALITIRVVRL